MNTKYRFAFMPMRSSEQLEVCILDENYFGNAITLQGAAEPIITEEDDDTDFFKPVRTQTGYINVVDDGTGSPLTDWKDLLPGSNTARPVILRKSATPTDVLWTGFVQMQQADEVIYEYPAERSLAIYDVLGVLEFIYFRPLGNQATTNQYINFASLIKKIVDEIPADVRPTDFYFQGYNQNNPHVTAKLLAKVNPQLFYEMKDEDFIINPYTDSMNNLTCRYTCKDVLEEVCKFWGFACHSCGMSLYFVHDFVLGAYDQEDCGHEDYLHLTYAQLTSAAAGTISGSRYTPNPVPPSPTPTPLPTSVVITGNMTVSTENELSLLKPYNVVTVESDAGGKTDIITAFPNGVRESLGNSLFQQPAGTSKMKMSVATASNYSCCDHIYRFTGSALGMGNVFGIQSDAERFAEEDGYSYDYIAGTFFSYVAGTGSPAYNFELASRWPGIFAGCRMSMQATFFNSNGDKYNDTEGDSDKWGPVGRHIFTMNVVFEAANGSVYYFNGTIWTTSPVDLPCRVGGSDNYIYPLTQSMYPVVSPLLPNTFRRIPCKYITFDGLPCTVGRLVLKFYGYTYESTGGIADVKIKIERKEIPSANASVKDSNTYTLPDEYAIHDRIKNEWSEDMIFSSDNRNQFGMGTVVAQDNTLLSLVTEGDGKTYHPEQWRTNMVYAFNRHTRQMLSTELDNTLAAVEEITPALRISHRGDLFLPIAISHYWRDSIKKIVAIAIGQGTVQYTVSVNAGTGIQSVSGGGTVYKGDPVSVSCVVATGYVFHHWQDGSGNILSYNQNYNIPAVNGTMALTAVGMADTRTFTVTIRTSIGITSVSGAGTYAVGQIANISCVVDSDHTFASWTEDDVSGPIVSMNQSFQLTVNRNIVLYPYAEANESGVKRITFHISSPGWGYIDDDGYQYHDGDEYEMIEGEVRLYIAVPATGYEFFRWLKNGNQYSQNAELTVDESDFEDGDTLTAVFKEQTVVTQYSLKLYSNLDGSRISVRINNGAATNYDFENTGSGNILSEPLSVTINIPAGATVEIRQSVLVTSTASFRQWLDYAWGTVLGREASYSFTMNAAREIESVYVN